MSPLLFGGDTSIRSIIQWIVLLFLFMFVMPKMYFYQIFAKLEASARKLEALSVKGQKHVVTETSKFGKDKKEIKSILSGFIDFFMIPPVSLDPYGILLKLEHIVNNTEDRFKKVAHDLVPKADSEEVMNVFMGLQAAVSVHTIAKIVRHWVELIKKFKNLQIAMILQMQLPIIEKIAEAEMRGLNAFLKGFAIGDGIGPLVVANLSKTGGKEIAQDVIMEEQDWSGRKVYLLKARGPGGRLGKIGEAVKIVCKRRKITNILTVDAAQKLEGEKTGVISEGIGVAMGGIGVQKEHIERVATDLKIPLDAIAIKMSQFEAISPMPKKVIAARDVAVKRVKDTIMKLKKGSSVVVVGVGNTCGVPNMNKDLKDAIKKIEIIAKKEEQRKKEEKEREKGLFGFRKGGWSENFFSMFYTLGFKRMPMDMGMNTMLNPYSNNMREVK